MNEFMTKFIETKLILEEEIKHHVPEAEIDRALEMVLVEGREWS